MALHEATRPAAALSELVEGRICPPEQVIEWDTPALTTEEVALANHVHGLLGDHIMGPDEVTIAVGMRILDQLEGFDEATREAAEREGSTLVDHQTFPVAVIEARESMEADLSTELSNLRYAGKSGEIVPAIIRHYSAAFEYPDGAAEDLTALGSLRAAHTQAVREGVSSELRLALEIHLDRILTGKRLRGASPQVSLDVSGSDDRVTGQLKGIHRDYPSGRNWLEVDGQNGRERVCHDTVETIGITVTRRTAKQPTEPEPQAKQPRRRRFLGR